MNINRQITVYQTAAIVASSIIGVGILPLPLFAVRGAGSGAPMVALLGTLIGFGGLALLSVLGQRFPNQTIVQYGEAVIGKWGAWIGSMCGVFYFAVLAAFTAREFGEVVITSVLKNTPVEVTVIVMLTLAAISSRQNLVTFAYIHSFYLPLLLIPAWLIVILSLKNAEILNLQPFWGNGNRHMLTGTFAISSLFQSAFIVSCIIPLMKHPKKALTASFWGVLISGALYIAIVAAAVSVFGAEEIRKMLWPTLELGKTTSLPANILERLDAAFLALWVTAVFTTLYTNYTLTITLAANLFRLKDYRMLAVFILPFVFMMAMQPKSIVEMYTAIHRIGRIGLLFTIGYPALLLLIALIRRKRGDGVAG